jgi:galactokinase
MIDAQRFRQQLSQLYGTDGETLSKQAARYSHLAHEFQSRFPVLEPRIFSAPGRTEIGGNHTDHNHGKVLAASINLDAIAVAAPVSDNRITIYSAGYSQPFIVKLNGLEPRTSDYSTTTALIRGIVARFQQLGFRVGGFNACLSSEVMVGAGLSSSAAIEILIGTILNALYNENAINLKTLAAIGQYAENVYFNKPCGLMDQIACAVGGIVAIDFENPQHPRVDKIEIDFAQQNYSVLVVNAGGNHADLTEEYAAVPREMKAVAAQLGRQVCRQITRGEVLQNIHRLRTTVGDRAVLRVLHFFDENERVDRQVAALRENDFAAFLREVNASGNSSVRWLQNCFTTKNAAEQGVTLALALTENFLASIGEGACRVHGGGFAGTIQAFLPQRCVNEYTKLMESVFQPGCVQVLSIRAVGTIQLQ